MFRFYSVLCNLFSSMNLFLFFCYFDSFKKYFRHIFFLKNRIIYSFVIFILLFNFFKLCFSLFSILSLRDTSTSKISISFKLYLLFFFCVIGIFYFLISDFLNLSFLIFTNCNLIIYNKIQFNWLFVFYINYFILI